MGARALPKALQSGWRALKHLATVNVPEPKMTVGLDIGSSAVKVVALGSRTSSGARPVVGQHVVTLQGEAESEMVGAIQEAISALAVTVKHVTVSVSGQSVIMRVIEMPMLAPQELTQALPFEAQRYLPFNIQDVVLDGAILTPTAEGHKMHVLMVACKRDLLERRVKWIRQAGLEPAAIDVDALALANAWIAQTNGHATSNVPRAIMNVGAQWTNLVILKGRYPLLVRDIPWGALKLVHHIAEQAGRQEMQVVAQLLQEGSVPTDLLEATKQACESFTADLQLSFDFFENGFGAPPEHLMVSGGLARCPGFLEAMKSHLGQPLVPWQPHEKVASRFAVAYGLALHV